jgi:glycosyltransferase involved in cell wall biosynthesis
MSAKKLKVAYILNRFPFLTETFIMREMYWIRQKGVELQIFSLFSPRNTPVHKQASELLPYTHYCSFVSWAVIMAQVFFILRSPMRYFKALSKTVWQTHREIGVLLRALLIFPKSVYFARQMEKAGIEHIHAHFVYLGGIAAGIICDLLEITFTIHPHAVGLFSRNQLDVRCELQNASQIITVSEYHRKYIANLCPRIDPNDIEIVYYGIETERFRPVTKDVSNNPIVILAVGRLIEKKGFEYLIDACARLVQKGHMFQCKIVGNGDKNALQAQIERNGLQDRVTLCGALEQKQVLKFIQESDIFALPCVIAKNGDRDGMPNVLIEAMACEMPVVTTPVTGIPEFVKDGETGLLVAERDVYSLAEALERLILDKKLRQKIGKQARQVALEKCQIQNNVVKLATIFRKVSKNGR